MSLRTGKLPAWLAAAACTVGAAAQVVQPAPRTTTTPENQGPQIERPPDPPRSVRDPLAPEWQRLPKPAQFNGFPTLFPSGLGAFGAYPSAGGQPAGLPAGRQRVSLPPTVDEEPDWPQGLGMRDAEALPYVPGQALLVRHAERVWWKAPDEDVFVPLYFYDKLRSAVVGTAVEVRQAGEFELLFHGGGRCVAQGQTRLDIEAMDETRVAVHLPVFTKVRLQTSGREYSFVLPDGSTLVLPADVPPATPDELPDGPALVVLERASEPGWLGGRASIFNGGQRTVVWKHAFGETSIEPGHQVRFFLAATKRPLPSALETAGVVAEPQGDDLVWRATDDGHVAWNGAKFTLAKGSTLRLSPLLGQPFAPAPAAGPGDGAAVRR